MQITSINSVHTTGPCHVAFNTDQPLSSYAKEQLSSQSFGSHMTVIVDSNSLLTVETQGNPIDKNYVDIINNYLKAIKEEKNEEYQNRLAMLEGVAKRTGLPLDDIQVNPVIVD
ncbi:hypothetical protein VU08_01890 [Desulfobulbus sp. F5]|nr:hypothetical protein [Desulfobulbus sp. F5]